MQPLFRFFLKYYNAFLFFFLEVIAFILIINNNYYQQSVFINASNSFSGAVYTMYSNVTDYFNLKTVNKALAEQNALLLNKQKSSFIKTDNKVFVINDTLYQQQYTYVSAKVISNT
ncbi:MAG: rod shape-determining protein MreC, partial [Bacteroidota bacterium]